MRHCRRPVVDSLMALDRRVIRFAEFEFDVDSGELVGPGVSIRLQPQPAKVLAALLARPGELVTRDELKQTVWADTIVEADQGLNFCVRQIRAALGDEADAGRFIETLPRRGYRFVAPVLADSADSPRAAPAQPATKPTAAGRRRTIGLVTVVLIVASAALILPRANVADRRRSDELRLAIIPFVAPSGERWMVDLNRELVELLVVRLALADSGRIGVVGPVTTGQYAGDPRPQTEIGARLGVDVVLSGGIRPTDSTLFVQAIRVTDGTHVLVWREKVFRRSAEAIVRSIVAATRGKI
jgi:DNA-binding winged helix-turn-helix (wHTH) protein/TolB-like protein